MLTGVILWLLWHLVALLFALWILRWGGAERLEGTLASGFLISYFAPRWSADAIKFFVALGLILDIVWFLLGLIKPELRSFPGFRI
jgi:hypothetical protein